MSATRGWSSRHKGNHTKKWNGGTPSIKHIRGRADDQPVSSQLMRRLGMIPSALNKRNTRKRKSAQRRHDTKAQVT